MSFKILYVEDEVAYSQKVEKALAEISGSGDTRIIEMKSITQPEQLVGELDKQYDLVLADACFPDEFGTDINRLGDIIGIVKKWSNTNKLERPLPIIAYTRRDKGALDFCLARRDDLFDIWDKSSASPPYAAWRMTRIASEVARSRPDALLLRLIRQMPGGARWHKHVVEMTLAYSSCWTESDQIDRVKALIGAIGMELETAPQCRTRWEIMQSWEPLSRAVSPTARGHARHVLNVFWLGYYLLHHPKLSAWFTNVWAKVEKAREQMESVENVDPLEALSDSWFYAGLFHDVAGCIEKHSSITQKANALLANFNTFIKPGEPASILVAPLEKVANDLLSSIKSMRDTLGPKWKTGLDLNKPDHGIMAGVHLIHQIKDSKQNCFAREAARAMAVHNLITSVDDDQPLPISWAMEPIVSLLLLCDQLQTWDRERGDDKLKDEDGSERAELVGLEIVDVGDKPQIKISIDYLGPRFLDHAPEIFERVKQRLENVLQAFPHNALRKIAKPWPFSIVVKCSLNGRPLNGLKFGTD